MTILETPSATLCDKKDYSSACGCHGRVPVQQEHDSCCDLSYHYVCALVVSKNKNRPEPNPGFCKQPSSAVRVFVKLYDMILVRLPQKPHASTRGAAQLHSCMAAWPHGCRAAGLQGCRAAGLQGCRTAGLLALHASAREESSRMHALAPARCAPDRDRAAISTEMESSQETEPCFIIMF